MYVWCGLGISGWCVWCLAVCVCMVIVAMCVVIVAVCVVMVAMCVVIVAMCVAGGSEYVRWQSMSGLHYPEGSVFGSCCGYPSYRDFLIRTRAIYCYGLGYT